MWIQEIIFHYGTSTAKYQMVYNHLIKGHTALLFCIKCKYYRYIVYIVIACMFYLYAFNFSLIVSLYLALSY